MSKALVVAVGFLAASPLPTDRQGPAGDGHKAGGLTLGFEEALVAAASHPLLALRRAHLERPGWVSPPRSPSPS